MTAPSGWMRLDLHLHTRDSWDSLSDPEQVLSHGLERGLDRIAITDHNRMEVALEMAARHPEHVIAGEEVRTREGVDVIGLYLQEEIPEGTPAEEACRRIRAQGGIVYLPHPFAPGKSASGRLAERLASRVDVVEVFNARLRSEGRNLRAAELARRHGLPGGAGSDAHTVGEVGSTWVELPRHPNLPQPLLQAIARARIHGRRAPLRVFLGSNWAKVRKSLGRG